MEETSLLKRLQMIFTSGGNLLPGQRVEKKTFTLWPYYGKEEQLRDCREPPNTYKQSS